MNKLGYNPDVLSCLANLSNDEVFTPPQLANQMLDMLPQELFRSPDTRFLDPCCKSGVFLREIAKRLIEGLADRIPDLQERIDHIMHHQLYGIAITRLTSLMSRRSLYCSKDADGKYSISHFDNSDGNIRYRDIRHTWQNGKCTYCGASKEVYDRAGDLESHAYEFIHTDNPKKLFKNMTFDVIIGNPPYQLSDGGNAASAIPLYHLFVEQAKKLQPKYLIMIIPARWYTASILQGDFTQRMLDDKSISKLVDFSNATDCFPSVEIKGGICYYLMNKSYNGKCSIVVHHSTQIYNSTRYLRSEGVDAFVRFPLSLSIVEKIQTADFKPFSNIVSSQNPFGFNSKVVGKDQKTEGDIAIISKFRNVGYINPNEITLRKELVDRWKVMTPIAGEGGTLPHRVTGRPFVCPDLEGRHRLVQLGSLLLRRVRGIVLD